MEKVVYIAHCIDTEGPLKETIRATFERLKEMFGIELSPTYETLKKLQDQSIDLNGIEKDVAKVVSNKLLTYNDTWAPLDEMLDELLSKKFRNKLLDSFGNGWIYNWHCMDHVGFSENPRHRDLGFHNIFDHYMEILERTSSSQDGVHFHHHPIPFTKEAHHPATHFFSHSPIIFEIIARKIIERKWFPSVNRPGFHSTRPDSHWFLEQFIPFDIANQKTNEDYSNFKDLADGRFGDWRRAPDSWEPYHPSHDDYQKKGDCRRWIARSLNLGTRARLLKESDVEQAFKEAELGQPVLLSFNHHDFRDMRPDVIKVQDMINKISKKFPDVKFSFCEARDGMRKALGLEEKSPISFEIKMDNNKLQVFTNKPTFGPQPFLAIKTKEGRFFHDNFDFQKPFHEWSYVFDNITFPLNAIESVGIGSCDSVGNVTVVTINPQTGDFSQLQF
tara:strand:- start:6911 stop:8248 length:1338 start_codon:yes stop_codon:yes gene_type:complete